MILLISAQVCHLSLNKFDYQDHGLNLLMINFNHFFSLFVCIE